MNATKLLYLEDMQQLTCEAYVESVEHVDGKTVVYLDKTVFYPQGGGQPYDQGTIASPDATFFVDEVRFADGKVLHIGNFEGHPFMQGEDVTCTVDGERRQLHARLHSGGHVVDMAVNELGYDWVPGKGYHFPDGPYVEYQGDLGDEDKAEIVEKLNQKIAEILSRGIETEIRFMPKEEMSRYCRHVPDYLPAGKPSRIVLYGDFGVPCGGTHVAKLQDIGLLRVRKIKGQTGTLRVSYEVS
ncbi:MAG: alanine--tRNA ligase-related protein [Candidatus Saccharibacteria bacterium]